MSDEQVGNANEDEVVIIQESARVPGNYENAEGDNNTEYFSDAVEKDVKPRTSWRATKEFRLHIIRTLSRRVIRQAVERAEEKF